ncbi:MAG: class II aldolase/adducin family protein, partial [Beijerinckiaceae bacterium]
CLADIDPANSIPPLTPYVAMRVGSVPLLPYTHPGSTDVVPLIETAAAAHAAVLLENHGPVVTGPTLEAAVFAAEELEETAKLAILTHGRKVRLLSDATVAELNVLYRLR